MPRFNDSEVKKTSSKSSKKGNPLHTIFVIDNSGSMGPKYKAAMNLVRSEIEAVKGDGSIFSIIDFSTNVFITAKHTDKVNLRTFPLDNMTALYDAIKTASELVLDGYTTVIKILTDGEENASLTWGVYNVRNYINKCNSGNDISIVFIGTSRDVDFMKSKLSLSENNYMIHDNTSDGINALIKENTRSATNFKSLSSRGLHDVTSYYKNINTNK